MNNNKLMSAGLLATVSLLALTGCTCPCETNHPLYKPTVAAPHHRHVNRSRGVNRHNQYAVVDKCAVAKNIGGIQQHYFFAFNKANVYPQYSRSIKTQADYLQHHPEVHVCLAGNADERGSQGYNVTLGMQRAKAIATALQQDGVTNKQLQLVSYGADRPVRMGHNATAFQCNRRVDIIYGRCTT